ncbi:MAG: substrate-binding domain-containing protein [Betaproteobacteria bacterium]|nr:MAG: substrate-binding domain-containing protein [Betaproteobacteria bacterium]
MVSLVIAASFCVVAGEAPARDLRLATTTSTDNSGLLDALLPKFHSRTGIVVRVISVGSGKAIKLGENGDVDVILVHSRPDEDQFVERGHGVDRHDVMYNDFVIVGPADDPAGVRGIGDPIDAFGKIFLVQAAFVSRGDESGTHKMEMRYWNELGSTPADNPNYRAAGRGMGAVLLMAVELKAYTLTDRATYNAMKDKLDLQLLVEGDARLFNPYGVIAVNPQKYPDINYEGAMQLIGWLTSSDGQQAIGDFKVDGKRLFFPNAKY